MQSCVVVSFNENAHIKWGFPEYIVHKFQANTIEYVNELLARDREVDSKYCIGNQSNLGCTSYLVDTCNMNVNVDEFWKCFEYSDFQLKGIDCKEKYRLKQSGEHKDKPTVFISYSSKDQEIADKIVEQLRRIDVESWIATKNIKEGSYAKQIMQAIRDAKIFLVVIK